MLPRLASKGSGRPNVVGTFRAEQMSKTSTQLVSVSPSYLSQQPKDQSRQFSMRKRRMKSSMRATGNGCTLLPALSTIDPLLIATQEGFFKPCTFREETDSDQKSQRVAVSRRSNIDRVVQRLYPGAESQMNDVEVLGYLTRPITGQPVLPLEDSKPASGKKNRERMDYQGQKGDARVVVSRSIEVPEIQSPQCCSSQCERRHKFNTHHELFDSCLTPSSRSNARHQLAPLQSRPPSKQTPLEGGVSNIEVVPEDAASAFFEADKRAREISAKKRNTLKGRVESLVVAPNVLSRSRSNSKEAEAGDSSTLPKPRRVSKEWAAVLDAVMPNGRILDRPVRAASEGLRILCFGSVGNENERRHFEREKVFYETCGTKEQIAKLWKLWTLLDVDGSNRVDIGEFNAYAEKNFENRKACDKVSAVLLCKKSSFTFEDFVKCMWPCAQGPDIEKMKKMLKEQMRLMQRVKTPPLLDSSEFEGLIQTFRHFDADGSGTISIQELVDSGLLDADQAGQYMKEWDEDGNGELDELEFTRMLCPVGFRAYPETRIATDSDGNQIVFEAKFGWRYKEVIDPHQSRYAAAEPSKDPDFAEEVLS
eukprot:gnl/MRDRNA2_/MRDRNA2_14973_c0_seq1.p1 gnl/MRDRNA2_/MRDRNA2_14973_c0~~gnl/MRDRNA2_/MRDRNA2_14973_c0_seq1.p1  ORF type:complete len:593 (+),score=106.97 gnl/MRDRNA2_/MRDRNA2_14973_c0_seq1:122-1900(+)